MTDLTDFDIDNILDNLYNNKVVKVINRKDMKNIL